VVGALLREREADEAAPIAGHKVDGLGSNMLGCERQVALVLAVLVVDHNHHAPRADFVERAGNVNKGRLGSAGRLGHSAPLFSLIRGGNAREEREMREDNSKLAATHSQLHYGCHPEA
jgi:hypothetical protein